MIRQNNVISSKTNLKMKCLLLDHSSAPCKIRKVKKLDYLLTNHIITINNNK